MLGLEDTPKSKPTTEQFMRNVAIIRDRSVDASNAADFLKGIVYMVTEHDLQPPELAAHFSAGEKIICRPAVPDPKDMIG